MIMPTKKSMGEDFGRLKRRELFMLGGAGLAGFALASAPKAGHGAEKGSKPEGSFMMFPGNYTWSAAVRHATSSSPWGGSAMGEVYKVCAVLMDKGGDNAAWFVEWNRMGEKVASLGQEAEKHNHLQTAASAYMRAGHYMQIGERLLQPRTAESQKAYTRSVELFKKGLPHLPNISVKPVEVPFEGGKSLPAYFVKRKNPDSFRWPTVVFFDGYDITKEMQFFKGVEELAKRGMACLVIDGPGNGESIRFRGMPGRYDSNVAGSAVIDYLETRDDVDKERLGVMGISLGGYYAPRCAALDKRYKACVAWGALYDMYALRISRLEKVRADKGYKPASSVHDEHFTWFMGVNNVEEAMKKTEKFTLKGVADKIECPFLVVHGEADAQVPVEMARMLYADVSSKDKTLKIFTREEGGAEHCQVDNLTIGMSYIADWFAEKLKSKEG
jgi:dienelactone hydrolase